MIHMVTGPGAMPDALSALQAGDILVCLDQAIHALPKGPWLTPVYVLATDVMTPKAIPDGVHVLEMSAFVHVVAEHGPTRTWSDRA